MATSLQLGGTVAGFIGALCLGFAQQGISDIGAHMEVDSHGRQKGMAFVFLRYPRLWRTGFVLLSLGFIFQFFGYIVALKVSGR